ncbi:MAG: DUF4838 domain-containing protein [Planctomycetes bacterium]|nr:DUF4838 domain-containing protein [Planctomycetota bacterium]
MAPTTLRILILAVALPAAAVRDAAASITLVAEGRSDYVIVVGPQASPSERFAAEELQTHIEKMSGAKLPIVVRGGAVPDRAVALGIGAAPAGLDVADLGDEGYIIRTEGERLIIVGGARRGTLYGVYTFLESLGVRWWYRDEMTIPQTATIVVPDTLLRQKPVLEYRDMMFEESFHNPLWMARNKVNGHAWEKDVPDSLGGRYEFVGNLVHSYSQLLALSGHEITDDMLALVDGRRTADQPCLSNPKTLAAMVDGVLKAFEESPDAEFVVVGQMDNHNYCRCADCAAIDRQEDIREGRAVQAGSRMDTSHSGQVIRFANRVAEEVEKRRPGSCIVTAAYEWSRAPTRTIRPRHNVFISLCSIECDFAHPIAAGDSERNRQFAEDIQGWSKIARKIFIWHYVGNRVHYMQPNAELETLAPNMKFFADHGCAGVFNQGTHVGTATDMTMLKQWVLAKALWNPQADGQALIEEFCRGYYGPAGQDILRYIDLIHAPAHERSFHNGRRVNLDAPYLRPEIIAEAEAILRQAEAKVDPAGDYGRRVRHVHMGVWYVLAKRGPGSLTWRTVEAKVGPLDPTAIAANLARVVKESNVTKILDNWSPEPWVAWLEQYMASAKARGGPVVPAELAAAAPGTFHVVQANQWDNHPRSWLPADGASDGYAAFVDQFSGFWYNKTLLAGDDYTPGRTYRLHVRAKADLAEGAEGLVWQFGISGGPRGGLRAAIDAADLSQSEWRVFDLGPWTPDADTRYEFSTNLRRAPKGANHVAVDCFWLSEVAE